MRNADINIRDPFVFVEDDKYYMYGTRAANFGQITGAFEHLAPFIDDDGGHGMIFRADDKLYLTYHTHNQTDYERPAFIEIRDCGDHLEK